MSVEVILEVIRATERAITHIALIRFLAALMGLDVHGQQVSRGKALLAIVTFMGAFVHVDIDVSRQIQLMLKPFEAHPALK